MFSGASSPFLEPIREYWGNLKRLSRDVRLYLLTAMLAGFATSGVFPVLLNLFLLRLGYEPKFIGAVNAAGQFAFILMSFPAGMMGRRWGTRRLIVAGILCYLVGYTLLPLAQYAPDGWQGVWLIGANLIASFGGPLYWVNGNLFMMDKSTEKERNHAFSMRTALFPLSGFVGSLFGGTLPGKLSQLMGTTLDNPAPYRYTLLCGALLFVPAFILMLRAGDTEHIPQNPNKAEREATPYFLLAPMATVMFLRTFGETSARGFYNLYFDVEFAMSTDQIGAVSAAALFLSVPIALLTPALAGRWGNDRILEVGMFGMAACMLPFALIPHPGVAAVSYIAMMLFAAATRPTLYVYRLEIVTAVWWATMAGTGGAAHGIGQVAASMGGGFLIAEAGYKPFFVTAAAAILAGALYFSIFSRSPRVGKPVVSAK